MAYSITNDRDNSFITKPEKGSLRRAFGKVAAVVSLVATMAFYALGFNISAAYYNQWQDNKADATAVTQTWKAPAQDRTAHLPWGQAGGALGISLAAGFTGIALGRRRNSYGGGSGYYSSGSSNDGFFWGYMMGSSNSGGGGSSSDDAGGAAALLVGGAAVALAAGASVVSYKALKANFGSDGM